MRIQNVLGGGGIAKFQIYWGVGTSELKSTRQGGQKRLPVHPHTFFYCNSPKTILNLYELGTTPNTQLNYCLVSINT